MKKILSLLLALILVGSMTVSASGAEFQVGVSEKVIGTGEEVTVTISLDETLAPVETVGFRNIQGQLIYDPEILTYVSHEMAEAYQHYSSKDMPARKYFTFSYTAFNEEGFTEIPAGTVVTIVFRAAEQIEVSHLAASLSLELKTNELGKDAVWYQNAASVVICKEHTWDAGEVTMDPTCTEAGEQVFTCTYEGCGATKNEPVAALGHSYEDGTCTRCGEEDAPVHTVTFTSASISLAGDIGINYYVQLSDSIVADEDAYMQFTVADETQIVPLSDARISTDSNGVKTYRFSAKVAAKQMTETVTAQMYLSDGIAVGEPKDYSVKAYCENAISAYSGNASYAKLVNLLKTMLNYGAYSQIMLCHNTDNLANAGVETDPLPNITAADLAAFAHGKEGSEDGIAIQSVSLLLESTTTIRFYFSLDGTRSIDEFSFDIDGETVEPVHHSGNTYYVDKAGVSAKNLDENSCVTVGGLKAWYNGMSYIRQVLISSSDADLINVCKALYAYCEAANAYFK